jgi:uncharacterized membrane protein
MAQASQVRADPDRGAEIGRARRLLAADRMQRLRSLWLSVRDSLWFVPTVMVCAGVALALGLVELSVSFDTGFGDRWPRLFGAGAEGSRAMLSAIATSMITVAGVVFSITIVALSLAASQYSPRVLRSFMADRPTQVVLGAFVAVFAYCLVVLRTIRSPDEGDFVPSLAVLGGVAMAFAGVALLIYFIHHVASAIQVSYIVTRIADDSAAAIDRLFPTRLGEPGPALGQAAPPGALPERWVSIAAPATGYVVGVNGDGLLERATRDDAVVRVLPHLGDFVIEGRPILEVSAHTEPSPAGAKALLACFSIQPERTVHQDAPYGIQQIVDVALKALSPGIHDPTTAASCIDRLGALLVRLSDRRIEGPYRCHEGKLRLIVEGPGYASLVQLCFAAITEHAADHAEIYERLIVVLETVVDATDDPARRRALESRLEALVLCIVSADLPAARRSGLLRRAAALRRRLGDAAGSGPGHGGMRLAASAASTAYAQDLP